MQSSSPREHLQYSKAVANYTPAFIDWYSVTSKYGLIPTYMLLEYQDLGDSFQDLIRYRFLAVSSLVPLNPPITPSSHLHILMSFRLGLMIRRGTG